MRDEDESWHPLARETLGDLWVRDPVWLATQFASEAEFGWIGDGAHAFWHLLELTAIPSDGPGKRWGLVLGDRSVGPIDPEDFRATERRAEMWSLEKVMPIT
jgi:hypothetical protein